jgi:hypothetical protein
MMVGDRRQATIWQSLVGRKRVGESGWSSVKASLQFTYRLRPLVFGFGRQPFRFFPAALRVR